MNFGSFSNLPAKVAFINISAQITSFPHKMQQIVHLRTNSFFFIVFSIIFAIQLFPSTHTQYLFLTWLTHPCQPLDERAATLERKFFGLSNLLKRPSYKNSTLKLKCGNRRVTNFHFQLLVSENLSSHLVRINHYFIT